MSPHLLAFGLPSGPDMFIIAVLVLVLFGAKKLPVFARSLGRSMGEFKKAKEEFETELHNAVDESSKPRTLPESKPAVEESKPMTSANSTPAPASTQS